MKPLILALCVLLLTACGTSPPSAQRSAPSPSLSVPTDSPGDQPDERAQLLAAQASLPSTLWVSPWYDADHPFTVTSAVQTYGVRAVLYNLDWRYGNYWGFGQPYSLAGYNLFCQARIAEARQTGTKLWFATDLPLLASYSRAAKEAVLRALAPCFRSSYVLGLFLTDEPDNHQAPIAARAGVTPASMREGWQLFRSIYHKPAWLNSSGEDALGNAWTSLGDIYSEDHYLRWDDPRFANEYTAKMHQLVRLAAGRRSYAIHGAFRCSLLFKGCPAGDPTRAQLQRMLDIAKVAGVEGVSWWGAWFDPEHSAPASIELFGLGRPPAPSELLRGELRAL